MRYQTLRPVFIIGFLAVAFMAAGCATVRYGRVVDYGVASWYGPTFNGHKTANGEIYNQNALTAANRTLPFNTFVKVIDLDNGRSVVVRINDRGPYARGRIIDLSYAAAKELHMLGPGTARVKLVLVRGNMRAINRSKQFNNGSELYTIQIGSFTDRRSAEDKRRGIGNTWIQKTVVNGSRVYRVFYGRYRSREEARENLGKLRARNISGFVKEVQN